METAGEGGGILAWGEGFGQTVLNSRSLGNSDHNGKEAGSKDGSILNECVRLPSAKMDGKAASHSKTQLDNITPNRAAPIACKEDKQSLLEKANMEHKETLLSGGAASSNRLCLDPPSATPHRSGLDIGWAGLDDPDGEAFIEPSIAGSIDSDSEECDDGHVDYLLAKKI